MDDRWKENDLESGWQAFGTGFGILNCIKMVVDQSLFHMGLVGPFQPLNLSDNVKKKNL